MITSCVKQLDGVPVLFINEKPVTANAYITYDVKKARYSDFAQAGFHLYSVTVMFGSQTFSELSRLPAFHTGIFEGDVPDYSVADGLIRQILEADPDAYIFPRLNIALPEKWELAHPDELLDKGYGAHPRVCFSSDLYAEESKRLLGKYIEHVEKSDYSDHIIGYQLSDGNTQEWFPFDESGGHGKRSREKFAEYALENGLDATEANYYRFLSEITARRICEICAFAKEKTGRRIIIGSFYGYTFECPMRYRCHHALERVLDCPDIDFISAPVSYCGNRETGFDHAYMLPLDSLILHGKLYLAENDTRTHLTNPPNAMPVFQSAVWQPKPKEVGLEGMRMQAARALTHGAGYWWFDMWGGWYNDSDNMALAKFYLELFGRSKAFDRASRSELAVVVDEKSFCSVANDDNSGALVCGQIRLPLGRIGAPYACFLASDFYSIPKQIKAFVLLITRPTAAMDKIIAYLTERGVPFITVTPQNCDITEAQLRSFAQKSGVFLYSDSPAVVYASQKYVFLHTCAEEKVRLAAPKGKRLKQLDGDTPYSPDAILPKGKGFLFELI